MSEHALVLGREASSQLHVSRWLEARGDNPPPQMLREAVLREWPRHDAAAPAGNNLDRHLDIADILHGLGMSMATQAAAILEGRGATDEAALHWVRAEFGDEVAGLVEGVHQMDLFEAYRVATPGGTFDPERVAGLRTLLLAVVEDPRVVVIKLANRVRTLREAKDAPRIVQNRLGEETREIYAPLASRLGIWQLKWELEDASFRFLEPDTYRRIAALLDERREDRERYIDAAVAELKDCLARAGIEGEVSGRPKHIFSIWRKMKEKGLGFAQVIDLRATRILVNTVPDCYAALGAVHTRWQHIPREFDDYIANPKGNFYRSLHTAVFGPSGKPLEIQIRTYEMHEHAELGVAAHWRYKEGSDTQNPSEAEDDPRLEQRIGWLRQVLEWKDESALPEGILPRFQSDLAEERIIVVSPKGKVVDLPVGSTPVDFAYRIHTDVGHRCRAARVDGRVVPLTQTLATGQQVEILTARQGGPSRDWLNPDLGYLKTGRARNRVRQWFRARGTDICVAEGREILRREMRRLGAEPTGTELAQHFNFGGDDEFLAAIGYGDISVQEIAQALQSLAQSQESGQTPLESAEMRVDAMGDRVPRFASCCNAAPGDPIVGYLTRSRGISVHRRDCPNVLRSEVSARSRLIELGWTHDEITRNYEVDVEVSAYDRRGLLRDVVTVVANDLVNVSAINSTTDPKSRLVTMRLRLDVEDLQELSRLLHRVAHVRNVIDAKRVLGASDRVATEN
ncbi:MAG: bifunctional (p)ppGpp synthetase/guanosine-3',5'-bis(diphosphate) 3'-pyrophosphohydrolase [Pseudomonadota bacterium]